MFGKDNYNLPLKLSQYMELLLSLALVVILMQFQPKCQGQGLGMEGHKILTTKMKLVRVWHQFSINIRYLYYTMIY